LPVSVWMLRPEYLEYIYDAMVTVLWPGTEPIFEREQRDRALIESAAARPFHTIFGQDAYSGILDKGVALFHSINANHAFMNGNKRTAVIALDHFLMANNHQLVLENDAMYAKKPPPARRAASRKMKAWRKYIKHWKNMLFALMSSSLFLASKSHSSKP
jgi:prophage maintenance system killer protein